MSALLQHALRQSCMMRGDTRGADRQTNAVVYCKFMGCEHPPDRMGRVGNIFPGYFAIAGSPGLQIPINESDLLAEGTFTTTSACVAQRLLCRYASDAAVGHDCIGLATTRRVGECRA